jgi:hypothetical protein
MVHNLTGQVREILERSPAQWVIENYGPAYVIDSKLRPMFHRALLSAIIGSLRTASSPVCAFYDPSPVVRV